MRLKTGSIVPFPVDGTDVYGFAQYVGRLENGGPHHAIIHSQTAIQVSDFNSDLYFSSPAIYPWPVATYLFEELDERGQLQTIGVFPLTRSSSYSETFCSRSPEHGFQAMARYRTSDGDRLMREDAERGLTIPIKGWVIDNFQQSSGGSIKFLGSRRVKILSNIERSYQYEIRPVAIADISYHFTGIGSDAPFHAFQIFQ